MRVDANVSVRKPGQPLGTRCEIKNVNSVRSVGRAIEYEAQRQIQMLEAGDTVRQQTRHWDEADGRTHTLRDKEDADDYRYFLEPDLVPIVPTEEWIADVRAALPVLPAARRRRLADDAGHRRSGQRGGHRRSSSAARTTTRCAVFGAGGDPSRTRRAPQGGVRRARAPSPIAAADGSGRAHRARGRRRADGHPGQDGAGDDDRGGGGDAGGDRCRAGLRGDGHAAPSKRSSTTPSPPSPRRGRSSGPATEGAGRDRRPHHEGQPGPGRRQARQSDPAIASR